MPLEHILRAMQVQADGEIAKITRAAEDEAAQLLADAQAQAVAIRARHRARVEPMLATQAAGLQNKAKLSALRALADAREQLLTDAFARAETRLAQIRASEEYTAIFAALARQAVAALDADPSGQVLIAYVDPRDVALARAMFAELNADAEIKTQPIPLGGLQVTTRDGRIAITNTLAARLARARHLLRGPVAAILVGHAESNQEWTTRTIMPMPACGR